MAIENFTAYNPTRLHFGVGSINKLGRYVKKYGTKALLVYGKGSVKKYGYFDKVVIQLQKEGISITEYSGIKPNPVIEDVDKAADLARNEKADVIVALGGGSVVDSAKVIALSAGSDMDAWQIVKGDVKPSKAIPVICILTLAATGTEMNAAAVVQNHKTKEKLGFVNQLSFPKESFLDPSFTLTVPKDYTAYGIVDLIAHALEAYFGEGEPSLTDRLTFEIIKDAMHWGPLLLDDLNNLELRSNIMLDATMALNGLTQYGKKGGDWGVHAIGHQLSLLYDLPHGATLSIGYIAWLKLQKDRIPERIEKFGKNVFGVSTVDETIEKLSSFFQRIHSPVHLSETGIGKDKRSEIIDQMSINAVEGSFIKLSDQDRVKIVDLML